MSIFRYVVKCPGCGSVIHLRISVGLDDEQPFYFVCDSCRAATRGKQLIWYEPTPGSRIELEAGEQLREMVPPAQVITIHPDLPAKADASEMHDEGGSPFLMHHGLLGERFQEFYKRLHTFRGAIEADWIAIRRWATYYLDANWQRFDEEGRQLFREIWEAPQSNLQRHDVFHRALDLVTAPLWTSPAFPEMKEEFIGVVLKAHSNAKAAACQYFGDPQTIREVVDLQTDIFHCIDTFVSNRAGLLPALAAAMYAPGEQAAIQKLRLFRDDFPPLRDLYITSFETCHHALRFVMATVNLAERGSPNSFQGGRPADLNAFSGLSNAQKARHLAPLAKWNNYWPLTLDRTLRNSIGHHAIRHDLPSGTLVLRNQPPVPYLEFAMKSLRLIQPLLAIANVLKYARLLPELR